MSAKVRTCDHLQLVGPGFLCTKRLGHLGPHAWVNGGVEWANEEPPEFETADAHYIVAALDRLTEQQRIANLIALADHAHERWGYYAGEAGGMGTLFSNPPSENGNMRVRDDIAESLGIRNAR